MSKGFSEAHVEEAGAGVFQRSGLSDTVWRRNRAGRRQVPAADLGDVILRVGLAEAAGRLNPGLPESARDDVLRMVYQSDTPSLIEENRRLHRLITEGVPV